MQEIISSQTTALVITASADTVYGAISLNGIVRASFDLPHRMTSRNLIPCIANLLQEQGLSLQDITYIACAQGPGSFTTFRSMIVTMNGLAAAAQIPMVAVNNLLVLAEQAQQQSYRITYALHDAFCGDVYVATSTSDFFVTSYEDLALRLQDELRPHPDQHILVVGSGITPARVTVPLPQQQGLVYKSDCTHLSLEQFAREADQNFREQRNVVEQVVPIYGRAYSVPSVEPRS